VHTLFDGAAFLTCIFINFLFFTGFFTSFCVLSFYFPGYYAVLSDDIACLLLNITM